MPGQNVSVSRMNENNKRGKKITQGVVSHESHIIIESWRLQLFMKWNKALRVLKLVQQTSSVVVGVWQVGHKEYRAGLPALRDKTSTSTRRLSSYASWCFTQNMQKRLYRLPLPYVLWSAAVTKIFTHTSSHIHIL